MAFTNLICSRYFRRKIRPVPRAKGRQRNQPGQFDRRATPGRNVGKCARKEAILGVMSRAGPVLHSRLAHA
jgi:hypothetical protein